MKPSDKENLVKKRSFRLKEDSNKILYVDNHVLVAIKEANICTQPNEISPVSLESFVKTFIKQKFNKKNDVFLHPIHRLDKEVEGLVLLARTSKALSRLNLQMREKKIVRKYIAQIEGKLSQKKAHLKDYIVHLSHRAKIVKKDEKKAKLAILEYKVIKEGKEGSIVEIELFTGRYHQIRAQFSNIGHPIVGDKKYFSKKTLEKIHLCSFYLEFLHPIKKEIMKFKIRPSF